MNSRPKDARRAFVRKPAQVAQLNGERLAGHDLEQRVFDLRQAFSRPLADEFGSYVKIVKRAPLDESLRSKNAEQTLQLPDHLIRQTYGGEKPHGAPFRWFNTWQAGRAGLGPVANRYSAEGNKQSKPVAL